MLVFLVLTFATLIFTHDEHDHEHELLDDSEDVAQYFYKFSGTETINGVPPEVRIHWMEYAMQTRLDLLGPCPFDAFGAVIVNRTTNQPLCATNNTRSAFDRTDHAEMRCIRDCSALFETLVYPGAGLQKSVWQELSLYTNAEPCPMCMSAAAIIGMGEMNYFVTIDYLLEVKNTQVKIEAKEVEKRALQGGKLQTTVISFGKDYSFDYFNPYFAWQYTTLDCPEGCTRTGSTCVPTSAIIN